MSVSETVGTVTTLPADARDAAESGLGLVDRRRKGQPRFIGGSSCVATAADNEDGLIKAGALRPNVGILDLGPAEDGRTGGREPSQERTGNERDTRSRPDRTSRRSHCNARLTVGVDEFIVKPFLPVDLAIRGHLQ